MHPQTFLQISKEKSLKIVDTEIDKHFITYLSHVRVFINSFYGHQLKHLSYEELVEFGLSDDVGIAFDSFSRYDQRIYFLYHIIHFPFALESEIIDDAYDQALLIFRNTCDYKWANDDADFFKHSKERIIKEYHEKLDDGKFFDLYESMAKSYSLTKNEKRVIKKQIKKKHDDLFSLDESILMEKYQAEAEKFAEEMKI